MMRTARYGFCGKNIEPISCNNHESETSDAMAAYVGSNSGRAIGRDKVRGKHRSRRSVEVNMPRMKN